MATARSLIKRALKVNGVLTKTEEPSSDEATDALNVLNAMLLSWSNDALLVYYRPLEQFTLSGGTSQYTMGSGGVFDTTRPIKIVSAYVRIGDIDYDLRVMPIDQFDVSVRLKSLSTIPDLLTYDNNHPLTQLTIYPVPGGAYPFFIRSEKALSELTIDQVVSLPPGWEQAIVYNLAVMLAPEYGQQVDQVVYKIANDSLGMIKAATARSRTMDTPPLTGGRGWNIYGGGW